MDEPHDLIVSGARVAWRGDWIDCDIGIRGGRIAALGHGLHGCARIAAAGLWVMPGGIDSHCHVDQPGDAARGMDDFMSASRSALFGGTTTMIPFAMPEPQDARRSCPVAAFERAMALAEGQSFIDYGFHAVLLPAMATDLVDSFQRLIASGVNTVKVFLTYEGYAVPDAAILRIMELARSSGVIVMLHAESDEIVRYLTTRLEQAGKTALRYHGVAHHAAAEHDATNRMTCYAEVTGARIIILHVSAQRALDEIICARRDRNVRVSAETCPQYLFANAEDLSACDARAARALFSPPARGRRDQDYLWKALADGEIAIWSSDHSPSMLADKLPTGSPPSFQTAASGLPGLETRLPLLFSEGLLAGRIGLGRYLELASSAAAGLYGLADRKGTVDIGLDADLVLWDPKRRWRIEHSQMHSRTDYCPYEGIHVTGKPVTVLLRGKVVLQDEALPDGEKPCGRYLPRSPLSEDQPFFLAEDVERWPVI
ncbi:amidohydrolase family protein [Pseudochelatococcus sp. B33]